MAKCRECPREVADNGYCVFHGGHERLHREWALKEARQVERTGVMVHQFVPKGQAVPTGGGLSQFGQKKRLSREEREALEKRRVARRAARLEAQPRKGSTSEIKDKGKKGGNKSGKRAR